MVNRVLFPHYMDMVTKGIYVMIAVALIGLVISFIFWFRKPSPPAEKDDGEPLGSGYDPERHRGSHDGGGHNWDHGGSNRD